MAAQPEAENRDDTAGEAAGTTAQEPPRTLWSRFKTAVFAVEEHLADWFGLNESRYQWAVDEYYYRQRQAKEAEEAKGAETAAETAVEDAKLTAKLDAAEAAAPVLVADDAPARASSVVKIGYLPPHLRGGGGSSAGGAPPPPSSYDRGNSGYGGSSGGGGFGRDDRSGGGSYGGSFGSRDSRGPNDRGGDSYGGYGRGDDRGGASYSSNGGGWGEENGAGRPPAPAAKAEPWKPSARCLALTAEDMSEIRKRLNLTVDVPAGQPAAQPPIESFADMMLHEFIQADVVFHGYEKPTPIQCQAMPVALSGRDILGCAETGSGKTASFAIPMLHMALTLPGSTRRGDGPVGLVMAPTRELAQQIEKEYKAFSRSARQMRTCILVGGASMGEQKSSLRAGVDVIVSTPGRLIDHLQQQNTSLERVRFVVLDEADRMLDMGFEPQIKEVMRSLPKQHQTLLFSATMPEEIEALAQAYLDQPVRIKVGAVSTPTANVSQQLEKLANDGAKMDRLLTIVLEEQGAAAAAGHPPPLTIVFVERKAKCDEVADALQAEQVRAAALHGGRSQGEREAALADFRAGRITVLVATDVASRGLDISGVAHVINLELPRELESYVHRVGRTGRAGATGRATSLYTDRDAFIVAQIRKVIADVEAGNAISMATGKAARRREREEAAAWRDGTGADPYDAQLASQATGNLAALRVDDKFKLNAFARAKPAAVGKEVAGGADSAWDD